MSEIIKKAFEDIDPEAEKRTNELIEEIESSIDTKLDNFFFYRPDHIYVNSIGIVVYDKESEEYVMWQQLQKYLINNYKLPDRYTKGFNFAPRHTPMCGVVDGELISIPFKGDERIKPELVKMFESIWNRMKDGQIKHYGISELRGIFKI